MKEEDNFYLYRHVRKDNGEVFYIGMGKVYKKNIVSHEYYYKRAYQVNKRNRFWDFVVAKTDYDVEILFESNSRDIIEIKEVEFIKLYGRRDLNLGTLVNLTDGGEGMTGSIQSEKTIQLRKKLYREGKTGLKPLRGGKHPMSNKVVEIATGKIFDSQTDAANHIGMDNRTFSDNINRKSNQRNYTGFKYFDESKNKVVIKEEMYKRPVYNYATGEIIKSMYALSKILGRDSKTLRDRLEGKTYNDTEYIYYEDFLKGLKPQDLGKIKDRKRKVVNTITNEEFPSISQAAISYGIEGRLLNTKLNKEGRNDTPFVFV